MGLTATIFFEPTQIGRGLLFREHFFKYRPTSYWRSVLRADGEIGHISPDVAHVFEYSSRALPVLRDLLFDSNQHVRWAALTLFARNGFSQESVPVLQRALTDQDVDVRYAAAIGLARWKQDAIDSLSQLSATTHDSDETVAWAANYAVWEIAPTFAAKQETWQKFDSEKWKFSAVFPDEPKEEQKSVNTPYGPSPLHQFQSRYGASTIIVGVNEYPPLALLAFTQENALETMAINKAAALGGKLVKGEAISRNGIEGYEDVVETPSKGILRSRIFHVGRRLYQIAIGSPTVQRLSPNAEAFILDSFEINYEPPESDDTAPSDN